MRVSGIVACQGAQERKHVVVHDGEHFLGFKMLEARPAEIFVVAALGVFAVREDEALEFLSTVGVGLQADVKSRRHGREIAAALRRHGLVERAVASSFWRTALRDLRAEEPRLALGITYPEDRRGLARRRLLAPLVQPAVGLLGRALPRRLPRWLKGTGASVAMLHYAVLSQAAVDRCHAREAAVWTWTVNEPELLRRVVALGVDGVISDDPRLFLQ